MSAVITPTQTPRAAALARVYAYLLRRADQIEERQQADQPARDDDAQPAQHDDQAVGGEA